MASYIALLRKDPDSDFGVDFPDFPGCITAGSTLDEARLMAHEALQLHARGMAEDGETLPEPSSLDTIMAAPDNKAAVAFPVDLPQQPDQAVRSTSPPRAAIGGSRSLCGRTRLHPLGPAAARGPPDVGKR